MKLKDRFKKALFAFFKDEILKSIGYSGEMAQMRIESHELKFTEIRTEILFDDKDEQLRYGLPVGQIYERAMEQARRELFEKAMNHIVIDKHSVIDQGIYPHRAIRISLFVGSLTER